MNSKPKWQRWNLRDILDVLILGNYQSYEVGDLAHSTAFKQLEELAEVMPFVTVGDVPKEPKVKDWDTFLAAATDLFVRKNTDYDSRFMRALVAYNRQSREAARTIWAWEVEKKLDRLRTWANKGELLVKKEDAYDSVIDLFNYSVQYVIFNHCMTFRKDPVVSLTEREFFDTAARYTAQDWVNFLEHEGQIDLTDGTDCLVAKLIIEEMTGLTVR